jgi:hypothetical protein
MRRVADAGEKWPDPAPPCDVCGAASCFLHEQGMGLQRVWLCRPHADNYLRAEREEYRREMRRRKTEFGRAWLRGRGLELSRQRILDMAAGS